MVAVVMMLATATSAQAASRTYFGFSIGVTNAPPPPRMVVVNDPDLVMVPGSRVFVVENSDYDTFRYGRAYYVCDDGYWYRSWSPRGPFAVVDVRYVPQPILTVPAERWKHHDHGRRQWSERGRGHGKGWND
jgi:hypothetical protein